MHSLELDMNKMDKNAKLLQAVREEDALLVSLLIKDGADVNTLDDRGNTPLLLATTRGDYALVSLLILEGADTNLPDQFGYTPIMAACLRESQAIFKILLERADISIINPMTNRTVYEIALNNNPGVVPLIETKMTEIEMLKSDDRGQSISERFGLGRSL